MLSNKLFLFCWNHSILGAISTISLIGFLPLLHSRNIRSTLEPVSTAFYLLVARKETKWTCPLATTLTTKSAEATPPTSLIAIL